jgi:hypothetical protein
MSKIKPTFCGESVVGYMEKALAEAENKKGQGNSITPLTTKLRNPEDYILLPGKTHGNYNYNDLLVSMYRLGMNPEVEQIAGKLGYSLSNSATEKNGRKYIGNINWVQALKLNLSLGGKTLNLRQFADFLILLKSGDAVDGNGRKINKNKLDDVLYEILGIRETYRAEWLDADFKYINEKLWLYSEHYLDSNGVLTPNYKNLLDSCLMTKGDKINLSSMNVQGMPIEKGNDFYYWCPDKDNKSFARCGADSGGSNLNCSWGPCGSNSSLGVRASFQRS